MTDAPPEVRAIARWTDNGHLIADVARLGYIAPDTLDLTYGKGTFWKHWRPAFLTTNDLHPDAATDHHFDVRWPAPDWGRAFGTVVWDPPYRLNGRPDDTFDEPYGTNERTPWRDRIQLIVDGTAAAAQCVAAGGTLLVKVQDQVCSGAMRWQTDDVTEVARGAGFAKVDRFDFIGHDRVQPKGRRQVHARGRGSTLLVFQAPSGW